MAEFDPTIRMIDRVIYARLPGDYADFKDPDNINDTAKLVEYFELQEKNWNYHINNFLQFNGDLSIFTEAQLDALAVYFGFTDRFYSVTWSKETKVCLFSGVYHEPFIWKFRGNSEVLEYVLHCHGIDARISKRNGFIVGINGPGDVIGSPDYNQYDLVIPENITPESIEYQIVLWAIENFTPFWCEITIVYRS